MGSGKVDQLFGNAVLFADRFAAILYGAVGHIGQIHVIEQRNVLSVGNGNTGRIKGIQIHRRHSALGVTVAVQGYGILGGNIGSAEAGLHLYTHFVSFCFS